MFQLFSHVDKDNQWKEKDHISYLVQHYCNPVNSADANKLNLTEIVSLLPTRETYVKYFNFLSKPYRDEIENDKIKRKIFTDIYNPEMSRYRKKQLTEKHYPVIKQPLSNMKCNKILKIKDSVPDGNPEIYPETTTNNSINNNNNNNNGLDNNINNNNNYNNNNYNFNYIVPYNTLFYQSNHITPVFFGRAKVKNGKYIKVNTNYDSSIIHPSYSGYLFPPLNPRPCVCSVINRKYDSLNIEMDSANVMKNDVEIRANQIRGVVGEYCYDNFQKPILRFDELKPDTTSLSRYNPDENTTTRINDDNESSTSFSNKDKEILSKTLNLFQNRVNEIKKEEDLTILKPNYSFTNDEPLDVYELMNIDNNNSKNIYKSYTSVFKQMMLNLEDYNAIRHLNTTDITKILDNKDIEKRIKEYTCLRCQLGNLNFHEYVEHICYKCKYNIYPCKLMTTCVYNFSSKELYNNHIRTCHRSRNYDNNNNNNSNGNSNGNSTIDIIPLLNVEIEIKRNEQWIKGIVKSFSNMTCLHEVEINGVIENISLTDQEFRYIDLKSDVIKNDYESYTKLIYDQNLRILDKYLDSHRIELNSNIHVLINQQLFEAKLVGLKPENRTFQVQIRNWNNNNNNNNNNEYGEIKEVTLGHIFHPSEYRRPNRKGTLLSNVDDSNLPIDTNSLHHHNNNNNNNNQQPQHPEVLYHYHGFVTTDHALITQYMHRNINRYNNNNNNNSPSSISDRNNNNNNNSDSGNDSNSENPSEVGALDILKGKYEFSYSSSRSRSERSEDDDDVDNISSNGDDEDDNDDDEDNISSDSDEPHNSESGSNDEAPTHPIYDISEFVRGNEKRSYSVGRHRRPKRGGARRGAGRHKVTDVVKIEESVTKGRGRGRRGKGGSISRGKGRGRGGRGRKN